MIHWRAVMLLRVCALALAVTGCRQIIGANDPLPNDGRVPDMQGSADGSGSGSDGSGGNACYTTIYGDICLAAPPNAPLMLSGTIPTGGSPPCLTPVSGATGDCVYAGTTISLASGTTVGITGVRPIIFIATMDITIDGTLDAGSHTGTFNTGPGADYLGCGSSTGGGSGGGGCGGSFVAMGGNGGGPNPYLAANALPAPTTLQGGCRGKSGGGADGGNGGHSGGALYLYSATKITVNASGKVLAGGAGGTNADGTASGGGGGGTGGMLVLDAPTIDIFGSTCAGGGGGGGGATASPGQSGGDGSCGGGTSGNGASGTDGGGTGGSSAAATVGGDGVAGTSGGGGGGGSVGVIKVHGTLSNSGTVVPPPS